MGASKKFDNGVCVCVCVFVFVCVFVCVCGGGGLGGWVEGLKNSHVNGGVRHNLGEGGGFIYKWGDIPI